MTETATAERSTEACRRPGRQPMPEAERCRLLTEAAETVFLRDGYLAASMDDVARCAGMSKRTLYQHYPSKAALFEATIEAMLAPLSFDTELEREPDLARALVGIVEAAGRHLLALRQHALFRLVISEVPRSPELAEAFHRATFGRGASALERRLAGEIRAGRLRIADAREAANMLFGMSFGATHIQALLGLRALPDESEIARLSQAAVSVFLRGALVR
ncbi:TetR/AcrR family transcriptional regulator [Elioraea rosea]|uniref:TetR/AcrR family transcriptional regulator n=1 Tax=Elioraea rosea TaxID=2492390 RepID=UPI0013152A03|nr:TetR/AcrR family transcriptional regulator [Elioraea rosea]